MEKDYGGVIWTNHALIKLKERGIKQGDAWATFRRPDNARYAKSRGAWIYHKTYGDTKIEVVAKKNEKRASGPEGHRPGGWVIISVWSKEIKPNVISSKQKKSLSSRILKLMGW